MIAKLLRRPFMLAALATALLATPFWHSARADDKPKELTEAERKELQRKAKELSESVEKLSFQGKQIEATQAAREGLAIFRTLFPTNKYPDGHAELATSLDSLGFVLMSQDKVTECAPFIR